MYKEKHNRPLKLPVNNETMSAWRDEPRAIDSADFDPKFIEYDRERRRKYFNARYEKPKELTSPFRREEVQQIENKASGVAY